MPEHTPSGQPSSAISEEAKRIFAELLARADGAGALSPLELERAFAAHPGHAGELRLLHARWTRIDSIFAGLAGASALEALEGDPAAAPLPPAIEDAFGRMRARAAGEQRYSTRGRLGRGGMGIVLRVFDRDLERELAMKIVRGAGLLEGGAGAVRAARFLAEARLAARLDHPGVVPVHDVGLDARGRLYFTMRLVEGPDLASVLREKRGEWTRERLLEVLIKVTDAIAFAHANEVVHRDLKPSNVMVGLFGEVYLLDWGLAHALEPAAHARRGIGGTPAYMAPEQARGERHDERADVYSLGALLYELLAGRRPYAEHERASFAEELEAVRAAPPADLDQLAPGTEPELVSICRRAMHRSPEKRYSSADELAAELRAFSEGRVVRAHASGAWPELRKWFLRNRALASALLAALLLALGGLAAIGWFQARGRAELLRLADSRRLAELERRVEGLWPADPAHVPELERWLAEARALAARRPQHERDLRDLVAHLREGDTEGSWRATTLEQLVSELGRFCEAGAGTLASVEARVLLARRLHRESLVEAADRWQETCAAVAASPRYRGLVIAPQEGLVPLGRDPASGLFEFALLASGEPPRRDGEGRLVLSPESAIVLVLIPPGRAEIGSRDTGSRDTGPLAGEDPFARDDERPRHARELPASFLAKHELSRAQWRRAEAGLVFAPPAVDAEDGLLPASGMSWEQASLVLARLGLALPDEEAWEYAARGDTNTRWYTGNAPGSLAAHANGARDLETRTSAAQALGRAIGIDRLRANPFGLVHVHGNVAEWTASVWSARYDLAAPADPTAPRVVRGGSFASPPALLRSAARAAFAPETRSPEIGVRPSRPLLAR
jgi:formylglycine-generating enzyme required for sulfatase activity